MLIKQHTRAVNAPRGPSPETAAHGSVAGSVRQTVMLAQKLLDPAPKPAAAPAEPSAVREKVIRKVEDAIYRDGPADAAESLRAELRERLEAAARPAGICDRREDAAGADAIRPDGAAGRPDP